MKIVELGKFLKAENLTEIVSEFCIGGASMPVQPRFHANSHTFSFYLESDNVRSGFQLPQVA